MVDFNVITENIEKYYNIIKRFEDEQLNDMLEQLKDRIAVCPNNSQKDLSGCEDGGFLIVTFNILNMIRKLDLITGKHCDQKSLFKIALIHDIGKIGNINDDRFISQDSDWHYEKLGMIYKKNPIFLDVPSSYSTLQILSWFGIKLDSIEHDAIMSVALNKPLNHMGKLLLSARMLVN